MNKDIHGNKYNSLRDFLFEIKNVLKFYLVYCPQSENIDTKIIECVCDAVHQNVADIITAVYKIKDNSWREKPQCVKAVIADVDNKKYHKCLYFSRANIPTGSGDAYAHLGIYGYTYTSLKKFVNFTPSPLEKSEKLEQLRALENGMSIFAVIADKFPISVDVVEDLDEARRVIK